MEVVRIANILSAACAVHAGLLALIAPTSNGRFWKLDQRRCVESPAISISQSSLPSDPLWRIDTDNTQALPPDRQRVVRPSCARDLASVTNDTAGLDVEGTVSDRQPRLIAEAGDEAQEAQDVGKV